MVRVEMMKKYNWYGNVEDARVAPACLIAAKARPARHVVHTGATYASCHLVVAWVRLANLKINMLFL
jgi:hypothetical protein